MKQLKKSIGGNMKSLLVLSIVFSAAAGCAFAGFNSNLNPMESGVVNFTATEVVGGTTYNFDADVEYAIYSPGEYSDSVSMPSDQYVYAYQITNNSSSDLEISNFAVGLIEGVAAYNAKYIVEGTEAEPDMAFAGSQQVTYVILSNSIKSGEQSALLLYSSPNKSTEGVASLTVGRIGSVDNVVPEPFSVALLGAGALCIRSIRRNRRRA